MAPSPLRMKNSDNVKQTRHNANTTSQLVLIRRALAQGVSDHRPLDSNNEQHPFFAGLIPNWTIWKSKINIEQKKTTSSRKSQH